MNSKNLILSFLIIILSFLSISCTKELTNEGQSKKFNEEVETQSISICKRHLGCYFRLAIERQNTSICDEIRFLNKPIDENMEGISEEDRDALKELSKKEIDELNALSEEYIYSYINNCYMEVAVGNQDRTFCDKIDSQSGRDYCYQKITKGEKGLRIGTWCEFEDSPIHCVNATIDREEKTINLLLEDKAAFEGYPTNLSVIINHCKTPVRGTLKAKQQNSFQIKNCTFLNKDFFAGDINISRTDGLSGWNYVWEGIIKIEG